MNPAIEGLIQILEHDPLPRAHTSSHWAHYGRETVVQHNGEELFLAAAGFESIARRNLIALGLNALERWSYRKVVGEISSYPEVWRHAKRLARDMSGGLSFNVFKSAMALSLLQDHWKLHGLSPKTVVIIGDGYGFLGALIRRHLSGARLYLVDLPKILIFQAQTHSVVSPSARLSLLTPESQSNVGDVTLVVPEALERIADEIDCAINIASMQEMTSFSIQSYFSFLRQRSGKNSRFYCVNREWKELPGGEVASFSQYPWHDDDEIFLDGPCPYYTHFLGLRTMPAGPRCFGMRVPFVNHFDGLHRHRLVRLAPTG